MKFTAILAAVVGAAVVNAQGYNDTHPSASIPYDSRTVSVPSRSHAPPTAITSLYTVTSNCGSITVYRPGTSVYPLSGGSMPSRTATLGPSGSTSGSASGTAPAATSTGGAAAFPMALGGMSVAGIAGLAAALML